MEKTIQIEDWKDFNKEKPNEGVEVLAYHSAWVDEDFNPTGTRIGFFNGEDFISAHWWDYQDVYETISHCKCDDNEAFSEEIKSSIDPEKWISLKLLTDLLTDNKIKRYIKKTIIVDALQFTGKNFDEIHKFCPIIRYNLKNTNIPVISTLNGNKNVNIGDYIVLKENGEYHPCNPDVFNKTYQEYE